MTRPLLARAIGLVLIAAPLTASSAVAAARFASANGTGPGPCSQAAPCDVLTAVNEAGPGDDVTIEPGTYGSSTPLSSTLTDGGKALTIHGQSGQPRPTILTAAGHGIDLSGGSSLSDVRVETSAISGIALVTSGPPSSVDHVFIEASGGGLACLPNGRLVDSVCWATGTGTRSTSIESGSPTVTLVNDTLAVEDVASSQGAALSAAGSGGGGAPTVSVTNTIVHGNPDVSVSGGATINLDHSSYLSASLVPGSAINDHGGNVDAAYFVDQAAGDLHEPPDSPTIDAGTESPLTGATDLDRTARKLGSHTDIGAYEHIPAPTCQPISVTTSIGVPISFRLPCSDAVGAPLAYEIIKAAGLGHAALNTTGVVTYTPPPGFAGSDSFTYSAANAHGTTPAATASVTVRPRVALITHVQPVLTHVRQLHRVWLERLSRKHRQDDPPIGTKFAFTLNTDADVTIALYEQATGRRVNGRCVPALRRNQRKPKCNRRVASGTLPVRGHAGNNSFIFNGRVGRAKSLPPGSYEAILTAISAGGKSSSSQLSFRIASGS